MCNVARREKKYWYLILYFDLLWTGRGSTVSFLGFQGFIELK